MCSQDRLDSKSSMARRFGLVSHVAADADAVRAASLALAETIAAKSPIAVRMTPQSS